MNDDMNSTPESSQQPVSIHDTPHKHHGALPLIAAMLGVFLVIETIVLVYVVTTYVAVDNAKEQAAENRQEIVQQVKERVKDRAAQKSETGLLSHLVLDGKTREISADADYTWMNESIVADGSVDDGCEDVYLMADESQRDGFGVSSAGLTDPEVRATFGDRVSDEGVTKLGTLLDDLNYSLFKVCTAEAEDYVIMLDSSNTVATLADYNDEHDYWEPYQPVRGVVDGVVSLWFDVLPEAPVLGTGYGDAGYSWWSYWVPTEYHSMQLVEACTDAPKFTDEGATVEGVRELTCEVEYVK